MRWVGTLLPLLCLVLAPRTRGPLREECYDQAVLHQGPSQVAPHLCPCHFSLRAVLASSWDSSLAPSSTQRPRLGWSRGKGMSPGACLMVKSMTLGGRQIWISTSVPSLVSCVTLAKSLNLPEPQSSHSTKYLPWRVESI